MGLLIMKWTHPTPSPPKNKKEPRINSEVKNWWTFQDFREAPGAVWDDPDGRDAWDDPKARPQEIESLKICFMAFDWEATKQKLLYFE